MKLNKYIFTVLVLFSIASFAQVHTNSDKEKPETFESKMVKTVMIDAYMQYKSNISISSFTYNESTDKQVFAESFADSKYQGVVEIENFTPYKYYIEKAVIYWKLHDPSGIRGRMEAGQIDINKFYKDNLGIASNEKCPVCVVVIGIGIISGCAANTALCNQRCNNCIYGASMCTSSCFTNSCSVQCNPPPTSGPNPIDTGNWIYNPWDTYTDWVEILNSGPFVVSP